MCTKIWHTHFTLINTLKDILNMNFNYSCFKRTFKTIKEFEYDLPIQNRPLYCDLYIFFKSKKCLMIENSKYFGRSNPKYKKKNWEIVVSNVSLIRALKFNDDYNVEMFCIKIILCMILYNSIKKGENKQYCMIHVLK